MLSMPWHGCRGRPLRGVLFWRWDMQVYAGTDPADYGVRVEDTTFDLIRQNADQLKILSAQQPPNAACRVGCWVPEVHAGTFSTVNRCPLALDHVMLGCRTCKGRKPMLQA